MINYLIDKVKALLGVRLTLSITHPRSPGWPKVRDKHLEVEPICQACGTDKNLNVHHIVPYHLDRSKELDNKNLITLCEEHHCHLVFGHLCSWISYNKDVRADVSKYIEKVNKRP